MVFGIKNKRDRKEKAMKLKVNKQDRTWQDIILRRETEVYAITIEVKRHFFLSLVFILVSIVIVLVSVMTAPKDGEDVYQNHQTGNYEVQNTSYQTGPWKNF